jgi:hypothetical protein
MPRGSRSSSSKNNSTANLGFEAKLWLAADKLRSNIDESGERTRLACPDRRPRRSAKHPSTTPTLPRAEARFYASGLTCRSCEEAQDNFRKDDDVRWQWREATWTTNGSPKGEHNRAHQYPSPQRGNANFAWVQHFIHHLAPQGMAGFIRANGSMPAFRYANR